MLAETRELLKEGRAELLVALAPDRLARDVALLSLLLSDVQKAGGQVQKVMMPIDDGPFGRAAVQMAGIFSEMERALIRDRSKRGRLARAKSGRVLATGCPPYGYNFEAGGFHIKEDEAKLGCASCTSGAA